jgi:hypothetical protein
VQVVLQNEEWGVQIKCERSEVEASSRELSFFADFWLVNTTGLPMSYCVHSSQWQQLHSAVAIYQPDIDGKLCVRVADSHSSTPFAVNVPTLNQLLPLQSRRSAKLYEIAVTMEVAPGKLGRTTVVTFSPRYLFVNNTAFDIWIRQPDRVLTSIDEPATGTDANYPHLLLAPGDEHSFHLHHGQLEGGPEAAMHHTHHVELGIFASSNDGLAGDTIVQDGANEINTGTATGSSNRIQLDAEGEHELLVPVHAGSSTTTAAFKWQPLQAEVRTGNAAGTIQIVLHALPSVVDTSRDEGVQLEEQEVHAVVRRRYESHFNCQLRGVGVLLIQGKDEVALAMQYTTVGLGVVLMADGCRDLRLSVRSIQLLNHLQQATFKTLLQPTNPMLMQSVTGTSAVRDGDRSLEWSQSQLQSSSSINSRIGNSNGGSSVGDFLILSVQRMSHPAHTVLRHAMLDVAPVSLEVDEVVVHALIAFFGRALGEGEGLGASTSSADDFAFEHGLGAVAHLEQLEREQRVGEEIEQYMQLLAATAGRRLELQSMGAKTHEQVGTRKPTVSFATAPAQESKVAIRLLHIGSIQMRVSFVPNPNVNKSLLAGMRMQGGLAGYAVRKMNIHLKGAPVQLRGLDKEGRFGSPSSLLDSVKRHFEGQLKQQASSLSGYVKLAGWRDTKSELQNPDEFKHFHPCVMDNGSIIKKYNQELAPEVLRQRAAQAVANGVTSTSLQQFEQAVANLVVDWQFNHRSVSKRRCVAVGVVNRSTRTIHLQPKLVYGSKLVTFPPGCTSLNPVRRETTQRAAGVDERGEGTNTEGGACVVFAWGSTVMIQMARGTDVELTIGGNAFVLKVKQQQHDIQASKSFSVTTNCKSIDAWTSYKILTVSDVMGLADQGNAGTNHGHSAPKLEMGHASALPYPTSPSDAPTSTSPQIQQSIDSIFASGQGLWSTTTAPTNKTIEQQIEALQALRPPLQPALDRERMATALEVCEYSMQGVVNQLLMEEGNEPMGVKIVSFGEGPYGLLLKERSIRTVGKSATVFGFADKVIAEANDIKIGDTIVSINLDPVVGVPFKELMLRLRTVPRPVSLGFRTFL